MQVLVKEVVINQIIIILGIMADSPPGTALFPDTTLFQTIISRRTVADSSAGTGLGQDSEKCANKRPRRAPWSRHAAD